MYLDSLPSSDMAKIDIVDEGVSGTCACRTDKKEPVYSSAKEMWGRGRGKRSTDDVWSSCGGGLYSILFQGGSAPHTLFVCIKRRGEQNSNIHAASQIGEITQTHIHINEPCGPLRSSGSALHETASSAILLTTIA